MYENNAKGWFGAYSPAGKSSAEKHPEIVYKNDIIENKPRTLRIFRGDGLFSALNLDKLGNCNGEELEEVIDIFKYEEKDDSNNFIPSSKSPNDSNKLKYNFSDTHVAKKKFKYFSAIPKERMKYHNKNKQNGSKAKKQYYPVCTKYKPKFSLVKPRLTTPPSWKKTQGHSFHIKQDNSRYYLNHEDLTTQATKVFINLEMFSKRGNSLTTSNVRCQTTKAFKSNSFNEKTTKTESRPVTTVKQSTTEPIYQKEKQKNKLPGTYIYHPQKTTKQVSKSPKKIKTMVNNLNDILNSSTSSDNDSYDQYQHIYQKQFKKKRLLSQVNLVKKMRSKKKNIKGPDFSRNISREMLFQREDKKKGVIPFSLPNFNQTRERPIMMIVYDKKKHAKYKLKELEGVPNLKYDPNKVLDKVNNHTVTQPPNFDLIQSRANDKSPLPSYMRRIHTKATSYVMTYDSLKMNYYSNGKFNTDKSSFWPKKSYNKYVNLNLLNSGKFLDDVLGPKRSFSTDCNINNLNKEEQLTMKSMRFYNHNFDDLMKECMISKFDNVTYKTTRKDNKLKDVQKFLDNYYVDNKRLSKRESEDET